MSMKEHVVRAPATTRSGMLKLVEARMRRDDSVTLDDAARGVGLNNASDEERIVIGINLLNTRQVGFSLAQVSSQSDKLS